MKYKITDSGAMYLCRAILAQSVNDYRMVHQYGDKGNVTKKELNSFFNSGFFHSMVGDSVTPEQFKKRALANKVNVQINPYREDLRW